MKSYSKKKRAYHLCKSVESAQISGKPCFGTHEKRALRPACLPLLIFPGELSGSACNLAPHFVAGLFVNAGQIMLVASVLFGIAQHFVRTGAARLPLASGEANVCTAKMVIARAGSALRALRTFSYLGHSFSP
jgi:hypothetical protein